MRFRALQLLLVQSARVGGGAAAARTAAELQGGISGECRTRAFSALAVGTTRACREFPGRSVTNDAAPGAASCRACASEAREPPVSTADDNPVPTLSGNPVLEDYLRLRAAGKHVAADVEHKIVQQLVDQARSSQHEAVFKVYDADTAGDAEAGHSRTAAPLDAEDGATDTVTVECLGTVQTEEAEVAVPPHPSGRGLGSGEKANVSAAEEPFATTEPAGASDSGSLVYGVEQDSPLGSTGPVDTAPVDPPGMWSDEEIRVWHARLKPQNPAKDALCRRLTLEANVAASAANSVSKLSAKLPRFLVDTDDDASSPARDKGTASAKPDGQRGAAHIPALDCELPTHLLPLSWQRQRRQHERGPSAAEAGGLADQPREQQDQKPVGEQRVLRVGVVGIPNAGKSTLTNRLVGGTVSAASVRPETTRQPALGVFTEDDAQVVLYDTPGLYGAKDYASRSQALRVGSTWTNVQECDMLALIVDCSRSLNSDTLELAQLLGSPSGPKGFTQSWRHLPVVLLLNKVDVLEKEQQDEPVRRARRLARHCNFQTTFVISAEHGYGLGDVRRFFLTSAVPAEWEFDAGQPTHISWSDLAAELVREKLYWAHNHEVPYQLRPRCVDVSTLPDGRVGVKVEVLVRSQRLKRIVSGTGNARLRKIEERVGAELAHMMRRHVAMQVNAKCRPNARSSLDTEG